MSMYQFVEVLDPDGSLTDALEDLIDCGALVEIDLADLPSHRIEAAARAACIYSWGSDRWDEDVKSIWIGQAEAAIRAFLETDDKEESDAPVN